MSLTNVQENVLHFLNSHLAMVALLMPWKKVSYVLTETSVETVKLFTLFDMAHWQHDDRKVAMVDGVEKWDDSLEGKSHVLIGVTASVLLFTILGFLGSVLYSSKSHERFGIDAISLIMGIVTLVLAVTFQADFDEKWVRDGKLRGMDYVTDPDQMFLVIGVIVGQILVSLTLMGEKAREIFQ
jgi:hypothetical protein